MTGNFSICVTILVTEKMNYVPVHRVNLIWLSKVWRSLYDFSNYQGESFGGLF